MLSFFSPSDKTDRVDISLNSIQDIFESLFRCINNSKKRRTCFFPDDHAAKGHSCHIPKPGHIRHFGAQCAAFDNSFKVKFNESASFTERTALNAPAPLVPNPAPIGMLSVVSTSTGSRGEEFYCR